MKRITRRRFLRHSSASLAGAILAGPVTGRLLDASASPIDAGSVTTPGSHETLIELLSSIVADLEGKFPYASALLTGNDGVTIRRDRNGKSVSEVFGRSRGVAIRIFDGASFHAATVGSVSPDDLNAAAARLLSQVAVAKQRYTIEPLESHQETWRTAMETDPASVSLADRAAMVDREFDRGNWDDPRVRNATVNTNVNRVQRVFVDRTRQLASETTMVSHSLFMFGFDQGRPGFAFVRRVSQGGLEIANLPDEELERARKNLVDSFGATSVEPGEYEVIFAPEVAGLLAHESFGHGVEMDQFVKSRAKAQEYLGKPVASEIVNMLDDPSIPGARGSYPFDDEGMLAGPTTIIENGTFVRPLTDLMSATFLGAPRSPNGRTQAWDHKVYARMSNTFFANGTSSPEELMASLDDGLYLEGFRNGIEDPHGWGIQFTANMAREVKKGKFTGRVFVPATVTGYVPEILSNITMIANDFRLAAGTCGKGHKEYVPVGSGGPHVRTRARVS